MINFQEVQMFSQFDMMLKRIGVIAGLAVWVCPVQAQQDWYWQNPLPQGNHLNDVQAVTSRIVYAVGDYGTFLKTSSGGLNWEQLEFPRRMDISDLHFVTVQLGWVVGTQGEKAYLYKTSSGGFHWQELMEMTGDYISVCFVDKNVGWVGMDKSLYHTVDGGATWEVTNFEKPIYRINFIDSLTGWAMSYQGIYRTIDGGQSWHYSSAGIGDPYFSLNDIKMIDENRGWMSGSYTGVHSFFSSLLFKTTDGGLSWRESLSIDGIILGREFYSDIEFASENMGWFLVNGDVYRTTDRGFSWNQVSRINPNVVHINSIGESCLWGAGSYGILYGSTDSGLTWSKQHTGTIAAFYKVFFLNRDIGFVGGVRTFLRTTNGGEVWEEFNIDNFGDSYFSIGSMWFTDSLRGWIGYNLVPGRGGLLNTTDGGRTWSPQIDSVYYSTELFFLDDSLGWFASLDKLFHTSDGGTSWFLQAELEIYSSSIFFTSPTSGWIGGNGGLIRTTDGGYHWNTVHFPVTIHVSDVFFIDPQSGWMVGSQNWENNFICKTTDGGVSWELQPAPPNLHPTCVVFTTASRGWVKGRYVLYTSDGGHIWEQVELPIERESLTHMVFVDEDCGWLVGLGGEILHTSGTIFPTVGDVNGDGHVNIVDVVHLVNYITGLHIIEPEIFGLADCNGDERIDVLDVVGIVNVILGIGECEP
jgi:photosystem II stability/assembly factor-like uncharacterized protein